MISKDSLLQRKEELVIERESLRQQYLAVAGAIADIDYWLSKEETPIIDGVTVQDLEPSKES